MLRLPGWILAIIILNAAMIFIYLNPTRASVSLMAKQSTEPSANQSVPNNATNVTKPQNVSVNTSAYTSACINSIDDYVENLENTSVKTNETLFFNDSDAAIRYVQNHSSGAYELVGTAKDIFALNESVISLTSISTDGRSITVPIVCNKAGVIGSYSACALSNASNITSYCHGLTEDVSECDLEMLNHGFWDDITYWITPLPGTLNLTQTFNFTIVSSRNRLEFASLFIDYERPGISENLFNQSVATVNGDIISIMATLDMTGKIYGGVIVTTYFKKKCYKYGMLSQYMYG